MAVVQKIYCHVVYSNIYDHLIQMGERDSKTPAS